MRLTATDEKNTETPGGLGLESLDLKEPLRRWVGPMGPGLGAPVSCAGQFVPCVCPWGSKVLKPLL